MKRLLLLCLLCLMLPLGATVLQSLSAADSLNIGSSFSLEIQTSFPLREIIVPDTLKQFRVLEINKQDQGSGSLATLKIVVLDIGALSFPKLELLPELEEPEPQNTDAFRVYVLETRAAADTLLRDIKAPYRYPGQLPFWAYLALAFVAAFLAGYLLIRAFQMRAPTQPVAPVRTLPIPTKVPAWKTALAQLQELRHSALAELDYLAYHYQLAGILRLYLEERYSLNAMEMTTSEIALAMRELAEAHSPEALQILQYCDAVKFAKWQPTVEQMALYTQALELYLRQEGSRSDV